MSIESGADRTATHFIQHFAIPPALHVGFAKAEWSGSQDPMKEPRIVHHQLSSSRIEVHVIGRRPQILRRAFTLISQKITRDRSTSVESLSGGCGRYYFFGIMKSDMAARTREK
jgi:hypothetical protein